MKSGAQTSRTRFTALARPALAAAGILAALVVTAGYVALSPPQRLPDFGEIEDVSARKQAFFEYLAPLVAAENHRVLQQRERLVELADRLRAGKSLAWLDWRWLGRLAEEYEVDWERDDGDDRLEGLAVLERRVDAVPVSLALVQAATESGWGRSRFAVEGNNLFGHWCYRRGCGLVPERRNTGAAHEVAAFESVSASVRRYLHNLNTHAAYAPLRAIRARQRDNGETPNAMALADGLTRYSERREEYVDEIKTVIRVNRPIIDKVRETL